MLKSKANWHFNQNTLLEERSIIDHLLQERGILTEDAKAQFLHPQLTDLQSPADLEQIALVKERIFTAIEKDEKIIIYGDYDADGVTSTALMMTVLIELGANCTYYIPNRFDEGYGLHKEALQKFYEEETAVVITVDTGIANIEEAAYAKSLGIDLIITDHHEVQAELPDAYAIIHPKLSPNYVFKELAGVGVAFQVAHYLLDELPNHLLDFVAIGTIADLVPLVGENRIFATFGLKTLQNSSNIGIKTLMEQCNMTEQVTEGDIGFKLAPRINAVGRLQDATLAVQLLLTTDKTEAKQIAEKIEDLNIERQQIVNQMIEEAEERVNEQDGIIILYDEHWHEGVLGIAASRLVNRYDRPVIMLTYKKETGELKGSARSIAAFNLFENCMALGDLFTKFGGHSQAAGMTFPFENLSTIKTILNEKIFEQLTPDDFKQEIKISKSLSISQLTEELVYQINEFAPFGMKNEEPTFHIKGIPTQLRQIGQNKAHLKMQFKKEDKVVDAIGFQKGHLYYYISQHVDVSLVGKLQINEWNGNKTVQILIDDLAVDEWQLFDYRGKQHYKNVYPYISQFKRNVVIVNSNKQVEDFALHDNVEVFTYESDVSLLEKTDVLYIYDLPYDLNVLEEIINKTNPSCIHVSYSVTEDAFLHTLPTREQFKWLYGFILKYSPIHLKVDLPKVLQLKKWSKERVIFMLKVFLDLSFVSVKDDVIYINKDVEKKSLQESTTYQLRIQQSKIEKVLYYSTYEELKEWLGKGLVHEETRREEVIYEL